MKNTAILDESGKELLRAFEEDLEERPARRTTEQRRAARQAAKEYEIWRNSGKQEVR